MYDCMMGDATLFQRADMVEAGWRVIQPVLDAWSSTPANGFPNYAAGSWGRQNPTNCWGAMDVLGERSRKIIRLLSRVRFRRP